ncbi:MAG TPA: SIMPL domain-containing protein [Burkholderiaceae bacterium]|jgi:predicted secreted protein|nr:SIMPL domain-containing protein [Burkholderiaceae bacterium]
MSPFRKFAAARCAIVAAVLVLAGAVHAEPPVVLQAPPQNVVNLGVNASREVLQDTLSITLAIAREGADAAALQSELRKVLDAALTQARSAARPGLVDVRTGAFSITPRYVTRAGGTSAQSGWQGRAELVIEGTDTGAISQLAGRITGMTVARVAYSLSRAARERTEAEVEVEAISRFRARADSYARQFGFAGYSLREVAVAAGEPGLVGLQGVRSMRAASTGGADELQPVEPGRATVTVTVSGSVQLMAR